MKEGREKGGWMGRGGEENGIVEGRRGGKRGGGNERGRDRKEELMGKGGRGARKAAARKTVAGTTTLAFSRHHCYNPHPYPTLHQHATITTSTTGEKKTLTTAAACPARS